MATQILIRDNDDPLPQESECLGKLALGLGIASTIALTCFMLNYLL